MPEIQKNVNLEKATTFFWKISAKCTNLEVMSLGFKVQVSTIGIRIFDEAGLKVLTLCEPAYDVFVLRFQPKNSPRELFNGSNRFGQSSRSQSKKNFWLGVRNLRDWRHKWSSFRVILAHVAWPRAQPLGQSFSLKFSLETRLESFEPLIDFLAFLIQELWSKIN